MGHYVENTLFKINGMFASLVFTFIYFGRKDISFSQDISFIYC